ncbi:MAG: hypothetical protein OXG08_09175 [Gammaproteobacteria bacterium]|nr:hypothetical protein [Gammaproteobacteria bacterium]
MRWLVRPMVAISLLLVISLVVFSLLDRESVLEFGVLLSENHWKFTFLRVGVLLLVLIGLSVFRMRREGVHLREFLSRKNSTIVLHILKIGAWLALLELLLGQAIVQRILEVVGS